MDLSTFQTVSDFAAKCGVSTRRVQQWLDDERIPGVKPTPYGRLIPKNAKKPPDLRPNCLPKTVRR